MRNNQPVTNRQHDIAAGSVLVSRTNEAGEIVYGNDDFVEASGFSLEELQGEPHNIVRHPDVPPEAFRDMWDTLKRGRPWSGIVKNRRKNGDHYWVRANANPNASGGYRSVRIAASREEIAAAEGLYARMRTERNLKLHEGRVVQDTPMGRLALWFDNVTITQRLLLWQGIFMLVFCISLGFGWYSMSESQDHLAAITASSEMSGEQIADLRQQLETEKIASAARLQHVQEVFVLLGLLGVAVSLVIGVSTLRRIKKGFATAQTAADAIASGNLTCTIPAEGQDEIGQLVAKITIMRNNLQELIGDLLSSITQLLGDANGLRAVAEDSAEVASNQSEETSSMAAAVEELSVSIDQVENHAGDAHKLTQDSADRALSSTGVIEHVAREIQHIESAVQKASVDIGNLEGFCNEISVIVKVISEVSEQTNLLALNAAIEAARAGEQGRGFAVVADEVRKLAEKTSNSSGEISKMISNIQSAARDAVAAMEASVEQVRSGVSMSHTAAQSMTDIRSVQSQVTQAVDGIATGLAEQAGATRHIAARVERVAQGTDDLAIRAQKTNDSAENIEKLTRHLKALADNFRVV